MKLRINYLIFSCLLVVVPLIAQPSYSQSLTSITESDVQALIDKIDRATKKGNVAGMIAPLASDVKIKMSILNPGSDKEHVGTLTKEQYTFNLRYNMRRKLAYQYERKNTRIKIYNDQLATVTSDVYETIKVREGTLRGASSEVLYVSLRNGKLMITAMDAKVRVY